jgi:zinc/manganese transport system permease protein
MLDFLVWPLAAALVLAAIHAWLGLHVLARGVIFVDLALAQVAALGVTAALLAGHAPHDTAAAWYALAFTAAGAAVLASFRERPGVGAAAIPQEALIGIVYAVAAALTVLVLERVPLGGEQIKALLVGSLVAVTADDVARLAALYAAVGAVHWLCRRPLAALSFGGAVAHARWWDFLFYLSFGVVVTSSVRVAGVLLVFAYLVVPAVVGAALASTPARRLLAGWSVGSLASVAGLVASYHGDLPPGATIVATLGATVLLVALAAATRRLARRARLEGRRALGGVAAGLGVLLALAGTMLMAFPQADHLWLDALERAAPPLQNAFLTPYERGVAADSRAAVARGTEETRALRAGQLEAAWSATASDAEARERLRQFTLGREELVAGDRLVLKTLARKARERQRWALGVPLTAAGLALIALRLTWRRTCRNPSPSCGPGDRPGPCA